MCYIQICVITRCVCSFRWRTSFLWSLIFGVPSMVIMMYFMFAKPPEEEHPHTAVHANNTNTSGMDLTTLIYTTTPKNSGGHGYQIMLIPGLSLDNLLMFLLATPVQVYNAFALL